MYVTTTQVAKRLGIDRSKVDKWIRAGELVAIDISQSRHGERPRWRIAETELEAFLSRRATRQATPAKRKSSRLPTVKSFV